MKSPRLLRPLAVLAVLLLVVPDGMAQRGRSSSSRGSSGSSQSSRSVGSTRSSRPAPSRPSASRSSISSSRSRPAISAPRSSSSRGSRGSRGRTSSTSRISTTGFGSRTSGSRGSYVAPSTSRGSTRYLPDSGRLGASNSSRYSGSRSSAFAPDRSADNPSAAGSTYTPRYTEHDADWYGGRGTSNAPEASVPTRTDAAPNADPSSMAPSVVSAPRSYSFPRAYRPSTSTGRTARPDSGSQPTGRRGTVDTSTSNTPSGLGDIARRYGGAGRGSNDSLSSIVRRNTPGSGNLIDRGRGNSPTGIAPGGTRGSGGGRYADGPRGRLNPTSGVQPTGRGASTSGSYEGAGGSRADGRLVDGRSVTSVTPTVTVTPSITPSITPSSGAGTTSGYVTPGTATAVVSPSITKYTYYEHYKNLPYCYSPFSYWSWYAWCAPYYIHSWYWSYHYPNRVYVGSIYDSYAAPLIIENNTYVVDSSDPIVGEGFVSYGNREPAEDSSPEDSLELSLVADSYLELGDRAFREGRYGDSVHFYAKAIEYSPEEGALYLVLADALFATGDYHYAAYAIRRALEIDPSLLEGSVDKHNFYGNPEDFDRQLLVLETYVRDHPTDTDSRLVLGLNFLFGLRAGEAVRLLESSYSQSLHNDIAAALILASARRLEAGSAPRE